MTTMSHPTSYRPLRGSETGFSWGRFLRALLTKAPDLAEIVLGGFLLTMRGFTLLSDGFAYHQVTEILSQITVTPDRLGGVLAVIGLGQALGPGTERYVGRAWIAWGAAFCCAIAFLGYWGADLIYSGYGKMWAALMLSEFALGWRIYQVRRQSKQDGG